MIFYGATNTGKVRKNNEDDYIAQFLWDDRHVLCVAIDGLGGYEGGEIASSIAHESIVSYLNRHRTGDCLELLKEAVTYANNNIVGHQLDAPGQNRMGCVLTAGLFELDRERLNVAHVGDSRLYQYHDGRLRKLTHDHSLVGYREDTGELTEEEAMNHPQRNIVERILGDKIHQVDDKNFIEAAIFPLAPGAYYMFCSDGLSDMLTSAEMIAVFKKRKGNLMGCVDGLIDAALDRGGKDNVTVVIARREGGDDTTDLADTDDIPSDTPAAASVGGIKASDMRVNQEPQGEPVAADDMTEGTSNFETDSESDSTAKSKRRSPWATVAWLLLALAACAAGFFAGYHYHGMQKAELQTKIVHSKDSTIVVLQDSIIHLQEQVYDQSVLLDSVGISLKKTMVLLP